MAPNPSCSALAAAKERAGLSYAAIAQQLGTSEQHVVNLCTGVNNPTTEEFNALARVLKISAVGAPHDATHSK